MKKLRSDLQPFEIANFNEFLRRGVEVVKTLSKEMSIEEGNILSLYKEGDSQKRLHHAIVTRIIPSENNKFVNVFLKKTNLILLPV